MTTQRVPNRLPFLVFPALSSEHAWKVVATETNRTISRHKSLELAVRKAARLNDAARADPFFAGILLAIDREHKVPEPTGVHGTNMTQAQWDHALSVHRHGGDCL